MKRILQFSIFILMLAAAGANCDMGGMGSMGGGGMGHGGHMRGDSGQSKPPQQRPEVNTDRLREILTFSKELGLTDEQAEQIRKIRADQIKETSLRYEPVHKCQEELAAMLEGVKPDFAGARAKIKELTEAFVNVQMVSLEAYEKAFNLLDDGQQAKLIVIRERIKKEKEAANTPPDSMQSGNQNPPGTSQGN